ncbi:uroporphyrinogen-III synthase [Sphingomonas sp.]|uniref:uroporphyrinogen-III synthase n=1 Tax=Sphingomonas sp. TaxID=28214 RepID=UPI00286E8152|nr:uroporphyrinogen-III synthase [Sphingomonas sp.]
MRTLFILRPEPGASDSAGRAKAMGLEAVVAPLFAVAPVAWDVPDAAGFDGLLLTSANPVRHGGEGLARVRGLPVYAVGEASAAAARAAGFSVAASGDGDVMRLLGSVAPGLRLLHLCGANRRALDGAAQAITPVVVYCAEALARPDALDTLGGQVAAVHSPRAAARLSELVDQRSAIRIAAISAAAAEAAGDGWEHVETADAPSDAALLALAARLCDNRRQQ